MKTVDDVPHTNDEPLPRFRWLRDGEIKTLQQAWRSCRTLTIVWRDVPVVEKDE